MFKISTWFKNLLGKLKALRAVKALSKEIKLYNYRHAGPFKGNHQIKPTDGHVPKYSTTEEYSERHLQKLCKGDKAKEEFVRDLVKKIHESKFCGYSVLLEENKKAE